jgi:hypothetical protein
MTVHSETDTQEMEYAPAFLKPSMGCSDDHVPSRYMDSSPVSVTAMQKPDDAHETETSDAPPNGRLGDHVLPLNPKISPSKLTAMQNWGVEQETLTSRSFAPRVGKTP